MRQRLHSGAEKPKLFFPSNVLFLLKNIIKNENIKKKKYKTLEMLQHKITKSKLVSTGFYLIARKETQGQILLILKGIVCGSTADITLINLYYIITILLFLHIIWAYDSV